MVVFEHLRIISFEQFVDEAHTLTDELGRPLRGGLLHFLSVGFTQISTN